MADGRLLGRRGGADVHGDLVMPCPCCGSPSPSPERIWPQGIQKERMYSRGSRPVPIGERPVLILWSCPGARVIDRSLLRFGIITKAPWSCGAGRSTWWDRATSDLRRRSLMAEQLHLALQGLI